MPLDVNNNLVSQPDRQPLGMGPLDSIAPPVYGEHRFDQLYSEVDPSGFMTPTGGASGITTPFASRSRTASTENLISMNAMASDDTSADVLHTRLHGLANAGERSRNRPSFFVAAEDPQGARAHESAQNHSPRQSEHDISSTGETCRSPDQSLYPTYLASRRISNEDERLSGTPIPEHIEFSTEDLSKVPSYTTALHCRATAFVNDGLPNYQTATHACHPLLPSPEPPTQARLRTHDSRLDF